MHRRRPRGGALVLCAGGPSRCPQRTIEDERISARQAQHRSPEWDSSLAVGRWTGLVASKASIRSSFRVKTAGFEDGYQQVDDAPIESHVTTLPESGNELRRQHGLGDIM